MLQTFHITINSLLRSVSFDPVQVNLRIQDALCTAKNSVISCHLADCLPLHKAVSIKQAAEHLFPKRYSKFNDILILYYVKNKQKSLSE